MNRNSKPSYLLLFLCGAAFLLLCSAEPLLSQNKIAREVVASGATTMTAGNYAIRGTIGQPIIGTGRCPVHAGFFGFWYNAGAQVVGIRPAPLAAAGQLTIRSVYPNPARGMATVRVSLPSPSPLVVVVTDLLGRDISKVEEKSLTAGEHTVPLPLYGAAPGFYFIHAVTPGGSVVTGLR
ncbi:MAG: T9SS type A sorting domain-containing protein, partial [Bacteroidota bacterium]